MVELESQVRIGEELSGLQEYEVKALVEEFRDVFKEEPGLAQGACHSIQTPQGL